MPKCLYLASWEMESGDGISKKIKAQISGFADVFGSCDYVVLGREGHFSNFSSAKNLKGVVQDLDSSYEVVYVRNCNGLGTLRLLFMLCKIKSTKVIYEIPTYPYWGEVQTVRSRLEYIFKKIFIRFWVDKITYIGVASKKIWGVPAQEITNCISWPLEPVDIEKEFSPTGVINVVGVASQAPWHGYDRFILGLSKSKRHSVIFHVVGNGPAIPKLKNLVEKLNLSSVVRFYGRLDGKELSRLLAIMDCGIDSLARHRSGVSFNSSIKAKEYLAFGLPIVMSHTDTSISHLEYVCKVEESDAPIPIDLVIDFIQGVRVRKSRIQSLAYEEFSWQTVFSGLK